MAEQSFPWELRSWFTTKYFEVLSKGDGVHHRISSHTAQRISHVQLFDEIYVGDFTAELQHLLLTPLLN